MSEIFTSNENLLLGSSNDGKEAFAFCSYDSPVGELLFCSDSKGVAALWFAGRDKSYDDFARNGRFAAGGHNAAAKTWLDEYFSGKEPSATIELNPHGTEFQLRVWKNLCGIPYGTTTTYGEIAERLNSQSPSRRTSARAVGQAVGRNPIGIIIPCHRVIGAGNKLTGFNAGIDAKISLLNIENIDTAKLKR